MAAKTGFDALMHVVCAEWCLGRVMDGDGEVSDVTRFIPETGNVTADQFVDWVFLASVAEARGAAPKWQRARAAIRAAFVRHMGAEVVDAGALRWKIAKGGRPPQLPLSDPVAFARNLTDGELGEYREVFGEGSREWIIAQDERARRARAARPLWARMLYWGAMAISLGWLALAAYRWSTGATFGEIISSLTR